MLLLKLAASIFHKIPFETSLENISECFDHLRVQVVPNSAKISKTQPGKNIRLFLFNKKKQDKVIKYHLEKYEKQHSKTLRIGRSF